MAATTLLPVVLTVLAFALGVLVGYLWWGRQLVRARLTRDEALSVVRGETERAARTGAPAARPQEPGQGA